MITLGFLSCLAMVLPTKLDTDSRLWSWSLCLCLCLLLLLAPAPPTLWCTAASPTPSPRKSLDGSSGVSLFWAALVLSVLWSGPSGGPGIWANRCSGAVKVGARAAARATRCHQRRACRPAAAAATGPVSYDVLPINIRLRKGKSCGLEAYRRRAFTSGSDICPG